MTTQHICKTPAARLRSNHNRAVDAFAGVMWTCRGRRGCGQTWIAVAVRSTGIRGSRIAWNRVGGVARVAETKPEMRTRKLADVRALKVEKYVDARAKLLDKFPDAE